MKRYKISDRKYFREYARNHSENRKRLQKKYRDELKNKIIEKLGGKCVKCGFSDSRALQIDHINGYGTKERATMGRRRYLLTVLTSEEKGKYQLLCANCNWIKRFENNENRRAKIRP